MAKISLQVYLIRTAHQGGGFFALSGQSARTNRLHTIFTLTIRRT